MAYCLHLPTALNPSVTPTRVRRTRTQIVSLLGYLRVTRYLPLMSILLFVMETGARRIYNRLAILHIRSFDNEVTIRLKIEEFKLWSLNFYILIPFSFRTNRFRVSQANFSIMLNKK